ncbi:hypothetical protein JNW90_29360 [Micromonospora sp. STR1s_5]|nr:hypothetical protein [Micromonospora sp. STR1s_5]
MTGGLDDEARRDADPAYRQFVDELRATVRLSLASGQPMVLHVELHPDRLGGERAYLDLVELLGDRGAAVGGFWVAEPSEQRWPEQG